MKTRKSSLLQRMMAVLLAAVLVVGMVSNEASMIVLAQEDADSSTPDGQQDDAGENTDDVMEEDAEPEGETVTTPNPEEPKSKEKPEQETPGPDEKPEPEITKPDGETEEETLEAGAEDEGSQRLQALLERIAALPEAETYLAAKPDGDNEEADTDAYEEWLAGLYAHGKEVLAIQEAVEELSEEEQAQIPEEALAKLAAWVEIAKTAGEMVPTPEPGAQVMAAESSMVVASPVTQTDNLASGTDWEIDADGKLTISSNPGMTDWKENGVSKRKNLVKSAKIQSGVANIPDQAFSWCQNMTEITIPESVTSIGGQAFDSCSKLNKITIPESVESIGWNAFISCIELTEITIPKNVKHIDNYAFSYCSKLQTVTVCAEKPPKLGVGIFSNSADDLQIHVPNCTYLIADAEGWINYKSKIVPAAHTGGIGYSASGNVITQKCKGCDMSYGTATLSVSRTDLIYTGTVITPVRVTYEDSAPNTWDGEKPTAIAYTNNTNAGTATASLTLGEGDNAATVTLTFTIQPKALTGGMVTLSADSFPQTGNPVTPGVTVQDGGATLTKDTDYTVGYTNNTVIGTAAVTVTGKGNYSGTVTKQFQIVESDADKMARAKTVVENALAKINPTNDTTSEEVQTAIDNALSEAGITGIFTTITTWNSQDKATTSHAGKITVWVKVRLETSDPFSPTDYQMVKKELVIPKLPDTPPTPAEKYTVAVNNGAGDGEYAAGDTVTIKADAPVSGQQFDKWTVNSGNVALVDAASSTTTFTMPAGAVEVTATYKNKTGGDSSGGDSSGGSGGGNSGSGDHSGGSSGGNSGSGNNNNDNNDNGGFAGDTDNNGAGSNNNSGSGNSGNTATSPSAPGVSAAGQPKVKQEKEGNIQKEVRVEGEETLDAVMETPLSKLADIVLTEKEKQQAAAETTIRIVLDMKDASASVSAADRTLVETALNSSAAKGYTLGQYLAINLYKVIGDSRTAVTQTDGKITVRIDVPESLRNTDSTKTRTFAVLRVHDGKVQLLADLDQEADTITIETDRFSTYAVIYQDAAAGTGTPVSEDGGAIQLRAESGSSKASGSGKDDEPKTGDATPIELSATLAMIAGFGYLLLYFTDRERGMTEERKKELVSCLVAWAKQGGRLRKYLALAAIFVLLVYYHSIGKKTCVEWKEVYGE